MNKDMNAMKIVKNKIVKILFGILILSVQYVKACDCDVVNFINDNIIRYHKSIEIKTMIAKDNIPYYVFSTYKFKENLYKYFDSTYVDSIYKMVQLETEIFPNYWKKCTKKKFKLLSNQETQKIVEFNKKMNSQGLDYFNITNNLPLKYTIYSFTKPIYIQEYVIIHYTSYATSSINYSETMLLKKEYGKYVKVVVLVN